MHMQLHDVKMSGTEGGMIPEKDVPEVRTGIISPVVLALHRKDTYRIRENTAVTGGRPDIARLYGRRSILEIRR